MARTMKDQPFNHHSKEAKPARRTTARAFRHENRRATRAIVRCTVEADAVVLPVERGTCGWLTW